NHAWELAVSIIKDSSKIREKVGELRKNNIQKEEETTADIKASLEKINRKINNLYRVIEDAQTDMELSELKGRLQLLHKQKRDLNSYYYDLEAQEQQQKELEEAIVKFEAFAEEART